jgi:hypothetical protein
MMIFLATSKEGFVVAWMVFVLSCGGVGMLITSNQSRNVFHSIFVIFSYEIALLI